MVDTMQGWPTLQLFFVDLTMRVFVHGCKHQAKMFFVFFQAVNSLIRELNLEVDAGVQMG